LLSWPRLGSESFPHISINSPQYEGALLKEVSLLTAAIEGMKWNAFDTVHYLHVNKNKPASII
jgi:hypothetical protein